MWFSRRSAQCLQLPLPFLDAACDRDEQGVLEKTVRLQAPMRIAGS
jgi:hypothetical protein